MDWQIQKMKRRGRQRVFVINEVSFVGQVESFFSRGVL